MLTHMILYAVEGFYLASAIVMNLSHHCQHTLCLGCVIALFHG